MLNKEDNELLCRVENGAAMGELMRRYWMPAMLSADLETDGAPRRLQIVGEKLVAFRDSNGEVGILDEYCPHRGASLALARNENCALQCLYHGWRVDRNGRVVETPSEPADSTFKDRVRHLAYPVREAGGLVWTYIGPPADEPAFPEFEWTARPTEQVYTFRVVERCNWAQALEGALDSAHIGFLHNDLVKRIARDGESAYTGGGGLLTEIIADGHPQLHVETTPYGLKYGAVRSATRHGEPVSYVRTSHFVAPVWAMFPAPEGWAFQQGFVPIDDHTTMFYFVHSRTDGGVIDEAYRAKIRDWAGVTDLAPDEGLTQTIDNWWKQDREAMRTGESFSGLFGKGQVEDFAAQESMGTIFDRSREHLGTSDLVAIRMRRIMLAAARAQGVLPALGDGFDYPALRAAESVIPVGADWRTVGADIRVS